MISALTSSDDTLRRGPATAPFAEENGRLREAADWRLADSRKREVPVGAAPRLPILIVLDEDDATHSAVEMSTGDFTRILHAASPLQAFRWLREESVAVVVSGTTMGGINLTHLLCLAKRQHPGLANIMVSAGANPLLARLAAQGHIFCELAKPLKAGSLRASVKAALSTPASPRGSSPRPAHEGRATTETSGWLRSLQQHLFGC